MEDVFYSYSPEKIKDFQEICHFSRKLCTMPDNAILEQFYKKVLETTHKYPREKLEEEPDREKILREEAFDEILRVKARKQGRPTPINPSTILNKEWTFGKGSLSRSREEKNYESLKKSLDVFFQTKCHAVGHLFYPKGGYRMWHTNKYDMDGWLMFLVHVDVLNQSFIRYIHPETKEVITHWDTAPFSVNFFHINFNDPLWHCIAADGTNRWCQGFLVPPNWRDFIHST